VKFPASPVAKVPDVIVGVALALVVASYVLVLVAAVTVIALWFTMSLPLF
jgi:hypothetical protein